jgi:uncharacterized protein (TIGR03790 family)
MTLLKTLFRVGLTLTAVALATSAAGRADDTTGPTRDVLVVANGASADSVRIAEAYAQARRVPAEQVVRVDSLPSDPPDAISRLVYERAIERPVAKWLAQHAAQDRIRFIVLTKGVPLRIHGTGNGLASSASSVDSELTLLYRRMLGVPVPLDGPVPNPYFLGDRAPGEARPFSRDDHDIYLVARLDGFTLEDVLGLIERGAHPASGGGRFVLDGRAAWRDSRGNDWLATAAERLAAAGVGAERLVLDTSATVLTGQEDVIGYYSWGSTDPAIRRRSFDLTFRPGALAGMYVAGDGRTFREPPAGWSIGSWADKSTWHAESPQSLAGDLIRAGVTGVSAHVAEPLVGHTARPHILFPAYVGGLTLAEAYYLATPSLSWQNLVVGDPLCAPFRGEEASRVAHPPLDEDTDLPPVFSRRMLAAHEGLSPVRDAVVAFVQAQVDLARDDPERARAWLHRASALDPEMLAAHFSLATLEERQGRWDDAVTRYRTILDRAPKHLPALNNLAFVLADRKGDAEAALPLAERARDLAPQAGEVLDTLGWIHHLRGDSRRALVVLDEAVRAAPQLVDVRLHLAFVHDALGNQRQARAELMAALTLDPDLAERADVRDLRSRLEAAEKH